MDSMIIQELLIAVLSIGALAGGTACIVRRDKRFESEAKGTDDKGSNRTARRGTPLVAQSHSA